ncbi:hypothetical protein BpHYR1_035551 [Brachionus plicatilis]|uniref:Uncharacterized protein n=1 Tax=Brachionus plicatilis TaxID=10195 RepID=A0A3M7QI03_BRAPC|nr:hypothetical protein BpHYR1_035551 [Brachionus plicatilis]
MILIRYLVKFYSSLEYFAPHTTLYTEQMYINKKKPEKLKIGKNNIQFSFFFCLFDPTGLPRFFLTWGCGVTVRVSTGRIFFDIGSCTGRSPESDSSDTLIHKTFTF